MVEEEINVLNRWKNEYAISLKQNADQLISNVLTTQNINNINSQNLGMAIELYLKSIYLLKNETNDKTPLLSKYILKIEHNNIDDKENFLKFIDSELRKIGTVSKTSHNISHLIKNILMYDETLFFYQLATIKYRRHFESNKIEYVNDKVFYSGIDHMILTGDAYVVLFLLTKMGELKDWFENNFKTIDKLIVDARYNKINVNSKDFEMIKEISFVLNIINEYKISNLKLENNQLNDTNLRKSLKQLDTIGLKYIETIMKNKMFNKIQILNSINFINFIKYYIEKNKIKYSLFELGEIYNIILTIVNNKYKPNKTILFEDCIEQKKINLSEEEKNKINEIDPTFLNPPLNEKIEALVSFLNETLMPKINYDLNYTYKGKCISLYDIANKIKEGNITLTLKQKLFMFNAGEGSRNYLLYTSNNIVDNYDRILCRLCDKCDIKISEYMYRWQNPERVIEILTKYEEFKKTQTINLNVNDLLSDTSINVDAMFQIIEYCNKYNVDFFGNMVLNDLDLEEIKLIIKTCSENNVEPIEEMFGYDKYYEIKIEKTTEEIIEIIKFCGEHKIKKIYNLLLYEDFTIEEIMELLYFCNINNIPFFEEMFDVIMPANKIIQILNYCIENSANIEETFLNIIIENNEKECINEEDKYENKNDKIDKKLNLIKKIYNFCEENNIKLGHICIDKISEDVDAIDILKNCIKYHIHPIPEMFHYNLTTEEIKQIVIKCSKNNIPLFESLFNGEVNNIEEIGDSLNPINKKFIIKKGSLPNTSDR